MRTLIITIITACLIAVPVLSQEEPSGLESIEAGTDCFACHGSKDLKKELPEGRTYSLYVDKAKWGKSAHANMGCENCHGQNPHRQPDQIDTRTEWLAYQAEMRGVCEGCHTDEAQAFKGSVHATSDNPSAPNDCTGCHHPHEAGLSTRNKQNIVNLCGRCHDYARRTYFLSIHGQNLALGNENAAACINCHAFHKVQPVESLTTARLVVICSNCHKGVTEKALSGWFSHTPITGVQKIILDSTRLFYLIIIPLTLASMIAHQFLKHRRTMEVRREREEERE